MGGPLCSLVRGALAKVSEGPVGPQKSSTDNDEDISSFPSPLPPLPLSHGRRVGEDGGRGEQPSRYGRRHHILIWTKLEQHHLSRTRSYHGELTPHQPAEWTF
ncbi:neuronatin, isoform CRA_b [Rattus norvegicus]|uniref:Neuronatin, isoform CRA_b n=1 Tax=Rattus norvegicus TaxID=10116 RepID=A6JWU0_RAT|nr:neuronatin, isoform CRA_b [Rattus norvegicus]EDL96669.1 neuronatin, isoform CRA_b [Rattus norvegicus]EDL96671.1 neuronatin, isoform CRA_b [Rattus norvegicus]EDL96672.1 neuronatin, isoform CRA_b [Rattus norvegicus]